MSGRRRMAAGLRAFALAAVALFAFSAFAVACGDDDDSGAKPSAPAADTGSPSPSATRANIDIQRFRDEEVPTELANGQVAGKADAKVTLTVYEDFQCPICLRFTVLNEPTIMDEYVRTGKIKFEFKHYPILGQESANAAIAATCAAEQNKFWPYHKKLFLVEADAGQLNQEKIDVGRFSPDQLQQYAADLGLDTTAFNACIFGQAAADKVTAQARDARALGLRGTPGFVINGTPLADSPASPAEWRTTLDKAIAAAGG
jgi:protein-disulfide isomerase